MNFASRCGLAALCALATLLVVPSIASAHGHRDVGEYEFTVGFFVEPAFEGEKNGVDLRIADHDGEPVEGAEETLQVEIMQGDQAITLPIRAVFNNPGHYTADFFPTVAGPYTFRFTGKVGEMDVDESFTSEVDGFSSVQASDEIQFPVRVASARELQSAVTGASESATSADDAASSASTRATLALVVGALGLLAGGAGLGVALRRRG